MTSLTNTTAPLGDLIAQMLPIHVVIERYKLQIAALDEHPARDSEPVRDEAARLYRAAVREQLPYCCPPLGVIGGVFTAAQKAGHDAYNEWADEKSACVSVPVALPVFVAPPGPRVVSAAVATVAAVAAPLQTPSPVAPPKARRATPAELAALTDEARADRKRAQIAAANKRQREKLRQNRPPKQAAAKVTTHADVPPSSPAAVSALPQSQAAQNQTDLVGAVEKGDVQIPGEPRVKGGRRAGHSRVFDPETDNPNYDLLLKSQKADIPLARAKGIQSEAAHGLGEFFVCLVPDPLVPGAQMVGMLTAKPDAADATIIERAFREGDGWYVFGKEGKPALIGRAQTSGFLRTSTFVAPRTAPESNEAHQ